MRVRRLSVKRCTKCCVTKPVTEFGKHTGASDGLRYHCKTCRSIEAREYCARPEVKVRSRENTANWLASHQERARANLARWHLENKSRRNAEATRRRRELMVEHQSYGMVERAKKRARDLGVSFDLTVEDVTIPTHCPVLGIPLFLRYGKTGPCRNSPSLDRLNPKGGYTKDNVVVISHRANTLKNDASVDEVSRVLAYMVSKEPPTVARLLIERFPIAAE